MESYFLSDRGKVRKHNEDSCGVYYNHDGDMLAIVADGMGGHKAGDVASQMTVETLQSYWVQSSSINSPEIGEKWLQEHIKKVNEKLLKHSQENPDCNGMGTTLVCAIVTPTFTTTAHIGDSRIYLLNSIGFKQITDDHTLVNELVKSGHISKEDAEYHPRKNVILRALGSEGIEVDINTIILEDDDMIVLCSDGLSNKVDDQLIHEELKSNVSLQEQAKNLVQQANDNGGEDNITLLIIKFSSQREGR
ncbi:Stp1/IreP family PP2C-type Ser/Thr phosphatase [Bacillus timonensis]|nr:Stp1/IreP family PP2C-type Ser/Thr phosphatase [Bacillus timonensis]